MTNQPSERIFNKVDVAKTQLDAAIQAYAKGEEIVAVTLAGAAEEIFGVMCRRKNIQSSVEKIAELSPLSIVSDKPNVRIAYLNSVRNCLKHAKEPKEDVFVMTDLDSFVMIVRALGNSKILGISDSDNMRRFRNREFLR